MASRTLARWREAHLRLFFAVEMPPPVRSALVPLLERLRSSTGGVRWVQPEQAHLTLRFLGQVDPAKLDSIVTAVRSGTAGHPPVQMRTAGLGSFPERGRPRVIWLGLEDESGTLASLHEVLEGSLENAGFQREARAFKPHLTLGRSRPGASRTGALLHIPPPGPMRFEVHEFVLMESDLGPQGARYTARARFPLLVAA